MLAIGWRLIGISPKQDQLSTVNILYIEKMARYIGKLGTGTDGRIMEM